jgi:hypothetical protein
MKNFLIYCELIWSLNYCYSQAILSLSTLFDDKKKCLDKVKVGNERSYSCFNGGLVWYPVIYENFNSNYVIEELLYNYSFRYEDADNEDGQYVDNALSLHNALIKN